MPKTDTDSNGTASDRPARHQPISEVRQESPKVLLLAPLAPTGGIATWAHYFTQETRTQITTLDTTRSYMPLGARRPFRRAILGVPNAIDRIVQSVRFLRSQKPDVVYITCSPNLGLWFRDFPLLGLLRFMRAQTIIHLHGGSVTGFFGQREPFRWFSRLAFGTTAAIIVLTPEIESAARKRLPTKKVLFVPNFLPDIYLEEARASENRHARDRSQRLRVLHVGFQSAEKGTLDVLTIAGQFPDVDFVLAGNVPTELKSTIALKIARLGIGYQVIFAGQLTQPELHEEYSKASFMLFPTHCSEGLPMVILEAMAHGLPVLATDTGAISTILGTETDEPAGIVVSKVERRPSLDGLIQEMRRLATTPELRGNLGSNGRRRVARLYTARPVVNYLDDIIEGVAMRPVGRLHGD